MLNNDLHHPVTLAQELATLDRLSGGRLEVGLGAGHSFTESAAIGVAFDPPAVRKERLAEATEIIAALLAAAPSPSTVAITASRGPAHRPPPRARSRSWSASTGRRR